MKVLTSSGRGLKVTGGTNCSCERYSGASDRLHKPSSRECLAPHTAHLFKDGAKTTDVILATADLIDLFTRDFCL